MAASQPTGREVTQMTDFEMISIFLEVINVLLLLSTSIIALLTFLTKKDK